MGDSNVNLNLEKFVQLHAQLLSLERSCEVEKAHELVRAHGKDVRELEKRGVALRKVLVSEQKTGLYGRCVITYAKENSQPLPATSLSNGDIVGIFSCTDPDSNSENVPSGVVTQVSTASISVSFDESFESLGIIDDTFVNIIKLANDVTHKRLKSALDRLNHMDGFSTLHHALFGSTNLGVPLQSLHPNILNPDNGEIKFFNGALNNCQKEAVKFALLQRELAIVHGPPGTGKTTTVVEIILQEVTQGHRVLCCAPSNVAVDNLLEKLSKRNIRVLRLGHPARLNQDLLKHSLDAVLSHSDETQLMDDIRSEVDQTLAGLKKARNEGQRIKLRNELRALRKEFREREKKAMREVLQRADVILSTLTSAVEDGPLKHLPKEKSLFDVTVIDECSQALEIACWIALLQSKKTILAGDHLQLPPTIMSVDAASKGLSLTLMERALQMFGGSVVRMLTVQYRMNSAIMNWSSKEFYNNELEAADSVACHLLKDLPGIKEDENTEVPLILIDTSGCDMFEMETSDEISKANEGEVALVCIHIEQLIQSGVNPSDIAVITPYNLQVELIRLQLSEKYPTLEVRSVDGFQGREKEAVILSLVRSNNKGEIGFLSEHRRLNVAVTRAKRHVAVICNVETISQDPVLKTFTEYLSSNGEVRTASQYDHLLEKYDVVRPSGVDFRINDSSERKEAKKSDKKKEKKSSRNKNSKSSSLASTKGKAEPVSIPESETVVSQLPDKKLELENTVLAFLNQRDQNILRCPSNLTSYERMLVHEIAEQHGLYHESEGVGAARCIVLKKDHDVVSIPKDSTKTTEKEGSQTPVNDGAKPKVSVVVCSGCNRDVPRSNIELHKIRCEKSTPKIDVGNTTYKKAKKKSKKDQSADEEEIDQLLQSFEKLDTVCNHDGCKAKVSVLGVNCNFCLKRFCLTHGLPEAHGCGDAARSEARRQISRDGKLYSGSGRPEMKLDPVKKAQLHRKLEKKLNEMSDERKSKPKKK